MTIASENPKPVTAYCRACGKPLTEDTVRVAQGTVYCDEHLPQQAQAQAQAQASSPYTASSSPNSGMANPGVSPGLAFLLGLIPGVGAIYNGQYAKGLVHVLILGMLISINSSDTWAALRCSNVIFSHSFRPTTPNACGRSWTVLIAGAIKPDGGGYVSRWLIPWAWCSC